MEYISYGTFNYILLWDIYIYGIIRSTAIGMTFYRGVTFGGWEPWLPVTPPAPAIFVTKNQQTMDLLARFILFTASN